MNGTEMQTSYCGKNCDECKEKIEGKCPGCKKGPGGIAARGKICQLAQCCRDNNINSCVDCPTKDICANYQSRDLQPEYREKRNADKQNREDLRTYKRKQISNKFLNFWLIVLWAGTVFQAIPFVLSFGLPLLMGIIKVFSDVVVIVSLFRLSRYRKGYLISGLISILGIGCRFLLFLELIYYDGYGGESVQLGTKMISYILDFIAVVVIMKTHAKLLAGLNDYLSHKWNYLWLWYIGSFFIIGSGVLLSTALGLGIIGAVVALAGVIALLIIFVIHMFYFYLTALAFSDEGQESDEQEHDDIADYNPPEENTDKWCK